MKIDFSARDGGILFFNNSLAPLMKYTPNPTLTSISGEGSTVDMNVFLRNINYRPDSQFTGLEVIVVDISDNGCTGITADPEVTSLADTPRWCVIVTVSFDKRMTYPFKNRS